MNSKKTIRIICIVLAILMALSLVISVVPTAFGDNMEELDTQLAALNAAKEEKATLRAKAQNKLDALKAEQAAIVEEKVALEERNDAAAEEIRLIKEQIEIYNQKILDKGKEVEAAQQKENDQLDKYCVRIRAMEENGNYNILALILNAESFSGLLAAMDDYGDVMASDKILWDQLIAARENLQEVKKEYEEYKAECELKQSALEKDKAELEKQIADSEIRLNEIAEKIRVAEEEQKAAAAAQAAAAAAVNNFLAEYNARKAAAAKAAQNSSAQQGTENASNSSNGENPSGGNPSGNTGVYEGISGTGTWVWPFPSSYKISSTMKMRWGRMHTGIDIDGFGLEGSSIVAADSGTVIMAQYNGGYGNCVIIDHGNGYETVYAHLSACSVSAGQSVSQGETVGVVGSSGSATGTHLHFEMHSNGSLVDPLGYYSGYVLEPGAADES